MKHARILVTSPDAPARYLDITDDGYRIAARWVPLDASVRETPDMTTIMEYKHSQATTDLTYGVLSALFDSLPEQLALPITVHEPMASQSMAERSCSLHPDPNDDIPF